MSRKHSLSIHAWSSAAFICLLLPWLNPFAVGPSAAVIPWLVSAICGVLILLGSASTSPANIAPIAAGRTPLWLLLGLGVWIVWRSPQITNESATAVGAIVLLALLIVVGAQAASRPELLRVLAGAWLVAALMSSVIGLVQYAGWSEAFRPWVNTTIVGEAFANLRQRNQLASLTNIGLLAVLWFASHGTRVQVAVTAIVLLASGNAATGSRTGLLQIFIVVVAAVWARGRNTPLLVTALGSYFAAALALPWMLEAFTGQLGVSALVRFSQEAGCSSRSVLWANVLHLIAQKPLLGWGWGELDYAHYVTLYDGPRFCDILDNAHSLPLHLAVELGVPVAVAFCIGGGWLLWRIRPWREMDATRQMAIGVLGVIFLHSLLEYPLWYGPFQMAFGLSLGVLLVPKAAADSMHENSRPAFVPRTALAGLLLAICGYTVWDYYRISQIYLAPEQRAASYRENTLEKIRGSWLFSRQVEFAELTLTPLTKDNAAEINRMANELLHFSPEPKVIEKLIESAVMLGRDDEARFHLARYRAAFPEAHAKWAAQLKLPL